MAQDLIQLELFPRLNITEPRVQRTHTPIFQFITSSCLFYYGKMKDEQLQVERDVLYQGVKLHITITRQRGVKNNKVIYDQVLNYQDEKVFQTLLFQCYNGQHKVYASDIDKNVILYTSLYSIQKDIDKGLSTRFIRSSLDKLTNIKIMIEDECKTKEWTSNNSIIQDFVVSKKDKCVVIRFSDKISDEIKKEIKDKTRKEIAMANYKTLIDFRLPLSAYIYKTIIFNHDLYSVNGMERRQFNQYNVWKFLKNGGFEYKNKFQKQNLKRMVKKAIDELQQARVINYCDCFDPKKPNDITFHLSTKTVKETFNQPKVPKLIK